MLERKVRVAEENGSVVGVYCRGNLWRTKGCSSWGKPSQFLNVSCMINVKGLKEL